MNTNNFSEAISEILAKPDGVLVKKKDTLQTTIIKKEGSKIRLKLIRHDGPEIQSQIDLDDPMNILSPYIRIMMLALIWNSNPGSVHILGLGGGSLASIIRYHFPSILIDCTEINNEVYQLAKQYFGFHTDSRMNVFIQDGRDYLALHSSEKLYDIIVIDAFQGVGSTPIRLGTIEFIQICKSRLKESGTLVVNILPMDIFFAEKIYTIISAFKTTYFYKQEGACVIFANDLDPIPSDEILRRAIELEKNHKFNFSFIVLAENLKLISEPHKSLMQSEKIELLTDSTPPEKLIIPEYLLAEFDRNDHCPCGSGKKFKKCHGLNFK